MNTYIYTYTDDTCQLSGGVLRRLALTMLLLLPWMYFFVRKFGVAELHNLVAGVREGVQTYMSD